jgi:hypothetical protein
MIYLFFLLLFIFAVIGMTHIIVDSELFEGFRDFVQRKASPVCYEGTPWFWGKFAKIVTCYQCCGTWCGFFCGFLFSPHFSENIFWNILIILCSGFAGSFLAQWGAIYLEKLQAQTVVATLGDDNES